MNHKILIIIFLASLTLRLFAAFFYLNFDESALNSLGLKPFLYGSYNTTEILGDRDRYNTIAKNIALYRSIGRDEMYLEHPPLYPLFLSVFYGLFGYNVYSFLIPQISLDALNSVLIFVLAGYLFSDKRLSILAGLLHAFNPHFILTSIHLYSETLYIFLLLSVFLSLKEILLKPTAENSLVSGIVMGLAALCRSVFLVFVPFIFFWLIGIFFNQRKKLLVVASGITLSFALICGMWIARNYAVFNRALFSTDYKNVVRASMFTASHCPNSYFGKKENIGLSDFINWVRDNPKQYFNLTKRRLKFFFLNPYPEDISRRNRIISGIIFYTLFPLGYLGIISGVMRKQKLTLLISLYILSTALFHILTDVDQQLRYRLPMEAFMGIFACYGVQLIVAMWKRHISRTIQHA